MKKQFLTVALTISVLAVGIGIFIHSLVSTRPSSSPRDAAAIPPSDPKSGQKPPKAVPRSGDVLAEILETVRSVLPDAAIASVQGDKGKYQVKLAWAGKTGSARLRMAGDQIAGAVSENLPISDMPAMISEGFSKAVPDGQVSTLSIVTLVGGERHGQRVYQWDWGKNSVGEASLDGQQITMTEEITPAQLPPAIREAVAKAVPQASLDKKVKRITNNGQPRYVFDLKPAGEGPRVRVTASPTGELTWQ
jgi:hypothetical protein